MSASDPAAQVQRRQFLRGVSREALGMAATLVGASSAIGSMAVRAVTLERPTEVPGDIPLVAPDPSRSAHRRDATGAMLVADRNVTAGDPWRTCPDGAALARMLARHQVGSGPVLAPLAAWALAGTARAVVHMDEQARRNVLRATTALLRRARPASATLARTLDMCPEGWEEGSPVVDLAAWLEDIGGTRAEDGRVRVERVAVGVAGLVATLPPGDLVLHGAMSGRATGDVGLAGAILAAVGAGPTGRRGVSITASTPTGEGSPAHDDLVRARIPARLIADAAVASLLDEGGVAAVLVSAEWVAPDGSVLAPAGARSCAVLAAIHQVPLLVIDATDVTPSPLPVLAPPRPAATRQPTVDAPPLVDRIPAELVTAVVAGEPRP